MGRRGEKSRRKQIFEVMGVIFAEGAEEGNERGKKEGTTRSKSIIKEEKLAKTEWEGRRKIKKNEKGKRRTEKRIKKRNVRRKFKIGKGEKDESREGGTKNMWK